MMSQQNYVYPMIPAHATLAERYTILSNRRNAPLERAKVYSKYTLPYIIPEVEDGENQSEISFDVNAIGPRAIQYLANRYAMTLFPPNRSIFKLEVPTKVINQMQMQGYKPAETLKIIGQMEDAAKKHLSNIGARVAFLEILEHLFVAGNVLMYYPKKGRIQVYPMDQYVVRRQLDGRVAEIVTLDKKALIDLPQQYQNEIIAKNAIRMEDIEQYQCSLYTHIIWDGDKYNVSQAVEHLKVGVPYSVPEDKLRWLPLSLKRYRRETWGRGMVEDYINVFHALSILNECLLTGAAIATDIKYLVQPGSYVDIPTITQAPSGSYHIGERDSISNTGLEGKMSDLQFVEAMIQRLERLIGSVFLINSAVTRDAERVTRAEIRMQAQELETAHGGMYSMLNQEWLLPLAKLTLDSIDIKLEGTEFEPVILTGLDAMGRMSINDNIMILFEQLRAMQEIPEVMQGEIDPTKLLAVLASGLDVDVTKIAPSKEEKAQQNAQNAAAQDDALMKEAAAKGMSQQIGKASPEMAAAMMSTM